MAEHALPYEEPGIVTILIYAAFLLLLNLANAVLDRLIYCGLLAQIFIGLAWGVFGAGWLTVTSQEVITQLGYIGLILLVYEGGLSVSVIAMKADLLLSIAVATTEICLPIGLSFTLMSFADATPLQALVAGAALCSTSLGTTFTMLKTCRLTKSRSGTVLSTAAMMNGVLGLFMVRIIPSLGPGRESINARSIMRPVLVSLAFAVGLPLCCRFLLAPLRSWSVCARSTESHRILRHQETAFIFQTLVLLAFVTGASYAGTSNLFGAYLAGATISWWGELRSQAPYQPLTLQNGEGVVPVRTAKSGRIPVMPTARPRIHSTAIRPQSEAEKSPVSAPAPSSQTQRDLEKRSQRFPKSPRPKADDLEPSGIVVYEHYYSAVVNHALKPFFFASIGFSIPITQMFRADVFWRGMMYAGLMALSKSFCGLFMVGIPRYSEKQVKPRRIIRGQKKRPPRPLSLYPATVVGCAMIAPGEIGLLVSSIAQSNGIFDSSDSGTQDLFLIVTWAIMLCTVLGPILTGLSVRRMKCVQTQDEGFRGTPRDPFGAWGLNASRTTDIISPD